MARTNTTSAIVDNILRLTVVGGAITAGLVIPNLLIALDKPLQKYLNHLDKRAGDRELRRVVNYMKSQELIKEDYQHGLQITDRGRVRLTKLDFDGLRIEKPRTWDKKWRLVLFDIPEEKKRGRDYLTVKLHQLGFYQLQRSAWLHPFPCRAVIEKVATSYGIDQYITYVEITRIDNEKELVKKFKNILT